LQRPSISRLNRIAEVERKKVVNFDYLSKDAWKTLNVYYDRLSGSAQYDMAGEAESSVRDCIRTIKKGLPSLCQPQDLGEWTGNIKEDWQKYNPEQQYGQP